MHGDTDPVVSTAWLEEHIHVGITRPTLLAPSVLHFAVGSSITAEPLNSYCRMWPFWMSVVQ